MTELYKTETISAGEAKFRAMVQDLMTMEHPSMTIEFPSASKARSIRRQFYTWGKNLAPMSQNFLARLQYKLIGRTISIEEKASWTPIEKGADVNVPESQGKPA